MAGFTSPRSLVSDAGCRKLSLTVKYRPVRYNQLSTRPKEILDEQR